MLGGRYRAERVNLEEAPPQIQKTLGLTSFFQSHLAATPKKPMPPIEEVPAVSLQTDAEEIQELEKKAENLIV